MEKLRTMTQAERQSFLKDKTNVKTDQFVDLVKAGTITQAQADAIKTSLKTTKNFTKHSRIKVDKTAK
jgi:hypothetical protein